MRRRIKFANITLKNGQDAVLSTIELAPGLYETMLASPDFDIEYAQLRTTSEAQAMSDFRHLKKQYHVEPLAGRYLALSKELEAATAHGLEEAARTDDGGTCNMDAVTLYLPRWNRGKVEQAAKAAGVGCFVWKPYGSKFFVFSVPCGYQGNARTRLAEAMRDALEAAGYDAGMYYQID